MFRICGRKKIVEGLITESVGAMRVGLESDRRTRLGPTPPLLITAAGAAALLSGRIRGGGRAGADIAPAS